MTFDDRATGLQPGRLIAERYRLRRLIAVGGMSEVWEAEDEILGRSVAIKVLHAQFAADPVLRARFQTEAIAAARLVHPTIVSIYDTVEIDGRDSIVMELVRGRTMREFLDERGSLDPIEVVHIGVEVATALAIAHRAGIIHRDIKPANILLSDDGRVIVTDFGIAKVLDEPDLTRTAQLLGTVKYLAPEQVEGGPVDGRTDLYALGAVLYEALCGEAPFRAESPAALALARMHRDPTRPSLVIADVPGDLDACLMRALARVPSDRYATANDMRAALAATRLDLFVDPTIAATTFVPQGTSSATEQVDATEPNPRRSRSGLVFGLIVIAALVVITLLVANTDAGRRLLSSEPATTTTQPLPSIVAISTTRSFDPADRNGGLENDSTTRNAVDADQLTSWNTEAYPSRTFGSGRTGVGLIIRLAENTPLTTISIDSPSKGWSVAVHVSDGSPTTLADWGPAVATATDIRGDITLDLGGIEGDAILLWITDLGDGPPWQVSITDVIVTS